MSLLILSALLGTLLGTSSTLLEPPPAHQPIIEKTEETIHEVTASYIVEVTAYTSRPEETDDTPFITASGSHVRWGIVATNAYPMGTLIRFPDDFPEQVFVVEDRMNRRYKNRFDIWFPEYSSARQWGKRNTKIEILEEKVVVVATK